MKLSPSVKVGILTLVSVIILIFTLMWLKGRAISAGQRIDVNFTDVDGMRPGSAVQMMGIRVGQVEEVYPVINKDKSYVKVRFVITEPDISIPMASTISIQQSGIIGEKFLEITPPQVQTIFLPVPKNIKTVLKEGAPVDILADGEYMPVGNIKSVEVVNWESLPESEKDSIKSKYAYKVDYLVTIPGIVVPDSSQGDIFTVGKLNRLRIVPPADTLVQMPIADSKYTVVEPIRLKKFFEIQFKSAAALKETTDKINKILTEDSINDLKSTLKNTKVLSAEAVDTVAQANRLMVDSRSDLNHVVLLADNLSDKMGTLTDNVNAIVSDPKMKNNLLETTSSVKKSADSLAELIKNSNMEETLKLVNSTSKDVSVIAKNVKAVTNDDKFKTQMDQTINNLNVSLKRLSDILGEANNLTPQEKASLKESLKDSAQISKNLKEFSNKLNKRFLLFRLMF